MTRKHIYLAIATGFLIVYTLIGFVIAPMILTRMVPAKLSEQLKRPVNIEKIRLNPYTLSLSIEKLDIKDPDGVSEFVSVDRAYVNVQLSSILRGGAVVKEVTLDTPKVTLVRKTGTTFNFTDLAANDSEPDTSEKEVAETDEAPSKPFRFAVSHIRIIDGSIIYRDMPYNKTHTMADINWHVPFISNFTRHLDNYSEPALSCNIDGAILTVDLKTKPFKDTLETQVNIDIKGISLPHYASYIPKDKVALSVNEGILDLGAQIVFHKEKDSPSVTLGGNITLSDLDIDDLKQQNIIYLPKLSVSILPSAILENQIHIKHIHLDSPSFTGTRNDEGLINLAELMVTDDAAKDDQHMEKKEESATPEDSQSAAAPFYLELDEFKLSNATLMFRDFMVGKAPQAVESSLDTLDISVKQFSTRPNRAADLHVSTTINKKAPLTIDGHFSIDPVSAAMDLDLSQLDLSMLQPYLPENIGLVITGGQTALSGHVDMLLPADGPMTLTITGKTSISKFATVDPEKAESFISWSNFSIDGIHVDIEPLAISVDDVTLKDFNNQVVIFENGVTNIQTIFVSSDTTDEAPETDEKPDEKKDDTPVIPIRIGTVNLTNTQLGFTDRSVSPHFATRLSLKKLDVKGLTSENFKAADITADGAVDDHAPVTITGTLNPLSKNLFMDLDVSLSHVDMVPFSTYTGKYIGRAIEKGKLSLNVDYLIKDKAIDAGNHLFLDQFTLGKTVDSPDAMKLPVGLAISLLKDRKGHIDLNMPISGRTDDPNFKWGGIVIKTLVNVITKAATSPFSLVAKLVGGGEELRYIEFEPGASKTTDQNKKKLESIQTLLVERPGLKLDILGYIDEDRDRFALATLALERKIKAKEIVAALKKGAPDTQQTVASIVQTKETRNASLRRLYRKELLDHPQDGKTPKPLSDPSLTEKEMEGALRENITVTDADLGLLAVARANAVKSALLSDGSVPAERIFLKEPETLSPPVMEGFKKSRVELGLK